MRNSVFLQRHVYFNEQIISYLKASLPANNNQESVLLVLFLSLPPETNDAAWFISKNLNPTFISVLFVANL